MKPLLLLGSHDAPSVELAHLDDLWFQVAGTLCNLTCSHCFISCSPHNDAFGFLSLEAVRRYLEESFAVGVKEFYFTGGEPFLNKDMVAILELTLAYGPATVLTNGTVLKPEWLERLARAEAASKYSLEFRVSLDGSDGAANDPVRGEGTFERILDGIRKLLRHGFLPIVTVTKTSDDQSDEETFHSFLAMLRRECRYAHPRVKLLPTLRIGAEVERQRGYATEEYVTKDMLEGFDATQLICHHSRVVTDQGIYVCPILLAAPDARLGSSLAEAQGAYPLRHQACFTCYEYGSLCSNPSDVQREA